MQSASTQSMKGVFKGRQLLVLPPTLKVKKRPRQWRIIGSKEIVTENASNVKKLLKVIMGSRVYTVDGVK